MEEQFKKIKSEIPNLKELVSEGNIFIPLDLLRNNELNYEEKMYLSIYYCLDKNIDDTDRVARLKYNKLVKIKKRLYKLKYLNIKRMTPNEIKEKTIRLSHKGLKCEWCKKESYILHKHHYPLSAREGGKEVVNICPNCHYTYHSIYGGQYE